MINRNAHRLLPRSACTFFQAGGVRHNSSSAASQNFYHLFPKTFPEGPPPKGPFTLPFSKLRDLRQEFFARQLSVHPDLTADPSLKKRAEATSAHLNKAYQALADPLARAQHLLAVRGVDVTDDENMRVDDMNLLADVMRAREEVEAVASEAEWESANATNEGRIERALAGLERAFAVDDLMQAQRLAIALLYWRNAKKGLEVWRDHVDAKSWGRPPPSSP
jgi:molecular chaperone HscB